MYNKIFFSLLISIALPAQGMKQKSEPTKTEKLLSSAKKLVKFNRKKKDTSQNAITHHPLFSDRHILKTITTCIGEVNDWELRDTRRDIKRFSQASKILNRHYNNETVDQYITRIMAVYNKNNKDDLYIANFFGHKRIEERITHLFFNRAYDPNEQFTHDELQDIYYLNATRGERDGQYFFQQTLLHAIIPSLDIKKITNLIDAGVDCHSTRSPSLIALMANMNYSEFEAKDQKTFYRIVSLFLQKGISPDDRYNIALPTLLHQAAICGDDYFAYSLLKYGANPHKFYLKRPQEDADPHHIEAFKKDLAQYSSIDTIYAETDNRNEPWRYNAFTFAEGTWLKDMYDRIQTQKKQDLILAQNT